MILLLFITSFYQDIPESDQETEPLLSYLSQPYNYCGKGAQVVAYESQDGQYVLKLFKARHKKSFRLKKPLRPLKRESGASKAKWKQKFEDTTRRYRLAFSDLKEETGLLFLHFEKTKKTLSVRIEGKKLDISSYPFILQRKATLTRAYLKEHPEKRKEVEKALKAFFRARLEKGYSDPRQALSINYGFIDDKPIQIDVGKIEPFEGDEEEELKRIDAHIEEWLLSN